MVAALARLAERAAEHDDAGHDRPQPQRRRRRPPRSASASPTPARSCSQAFRRVDDLLARYPLRGIKGPVGTQQDQLDLLDGDADAVDELEQRGRRATSASTPSLDQRRPGVPALARPRRRRPRWCRRPPGRRSLATTIRLMAGQELVTEGFQAGPGRLVGHAPQDEHPRRASASTASRRSSRGHLTMVGGARRRPVERGRRVSCSVVRRVALPDAFFAIDGLFETFLTVLDEFGAYPAVIERELRRYLPFLATTKVLDGRGARRRRPRAGARGDQGARGRRGARACASRAPRRNDLLDRLAADDRLGLVGRRRSPASLAEPLVVRRRRAGAGRARSSPRSSAIVAAAPRGRGLPTPAPIL